MKNNLIPKAITELNNLVPKEVISIYSDCLFQILNLKSEPESTQYLACQFSLNDFNIVYREAKTTPKKTGQFVTFWKRINNGPIEPFNEVDIFDFYIITVKNENKLGQFIFPKSLLIKKGIITSKNKEGKRGFRIYSPWDITHSKQATNTQKWQLNYFYEINKSTNLNQVKALFKKP